MNHIGCRRKQILPTDVVWSCRLARLWTCLVKIASLATVPSMFSRGSQPPPFCDGQDTFFRLCHMLNSLQLMFSGGSFGRFKILSLPHRSLRLGQLRS